MHVSHETRHFYSREYYWCNYCHEENYQIDQRYHSRVDVTHPDSHGCCSPYDRQSSRVNFTATVTSYIQVTQNFTLCVETASPYEGHTSRTFFVQLIDPTSGLLPHTSGLPKILPWLCLTLLMTLGLWGAPSK